MSARYAYKYTSHFKVVRLCGLLSLGLGLISLSGYLVASISGASQPVGQMAVKIKAGSQEFHQRVCEGWRSVGWECEESLQSQSSALSRGPRQ